MPVIEEVCTITAKGQTTVPEAIRQVLGVSYGGRVTFRVECGTVSVHAAAEPEEDPALAPFLALLEADVAGPPGDSRPAHAGTDGSHNGSHRGRGGRSRRTDQR